jgi:hypothetical protein
LFFISFQLAIEIDYVDFAKARDVKEKSSGNGGHSEEEEILLDMDVSLNFFLHILLN